MSGYERMDRIIRWLDEHYAAQPTLAQIAALAGLSEFHFHREFVRWTGVTPKDFVQCLTLNQTRARRHNLCVTLEAATQARRVRSGRRWEKTRSPASFPVTASSARPA